MVWDLDTATCKPDIHTSVEPSIDYFVDGSDTSKRDQFNYDSSATRGQAVYRIQADEILFLKERLNTELSERTGKDLDTIKEDTDRDFYMSPKEAVEYGLIDLVLDKKPVKI